MNLHANAKTCPNSRELLARRVIEQGWSRRRAARAAGVSTRTVDKWVARYRAGEPMGDRSSAPRRVPSRTPAQTIEAIEMLRRLRMTAVEIAEILEMALSTVSRWLQRIGLGKRSRLEPSEPPNRYERSGPASSSTSTSRSSAGSQNEAPATAPWEPGAGRASSSTAAEA